MKRSPDDTADAIEEPVRSLPDRTAGRACRTLENATIIGSRRGRRRGNVLAAGVLDEDGQLVPEGICRTNILDGSRFIPDRNDCQARSHLPGRWLFGGLASPHFGHQITRMLGRLPWIEDAGSLDGILFAGFRPDSESAKMRALRDALFAVFGIDLPIRTVFEPTSIETLIVGPELFGEGTGGRAHPQFVNWSRKRLSIDDTPFNPERRIYVTRSRLAGNAGRIVCEDVLERNLAANGFEIVAPETLPLAKQIELYASAGTIVMADGSAGHVAAFAQRENQRTAVIARRAEGAQFVMNHLGSFRRTGARHIYIDALRAEMWPRRRASNGSFGELDFARLLDALVDFGAVPRHPAWSIPSRAEVETSKRGLAHDGNLMSRVERAAFLADFRRHRQIMPKLQELDRQSDQLPEIKGPHYRRILNQLHKRLQPEWYLEIGTFKGNSLSLAKGNFVAVDPMFRMSHPVINPSARRMFLFQETSDDFFESGFLEKNGIRPNLAFLDGLHHFEVLLRDVMNTERHMADGGIIALHDCCPTTHAMTARVQGEGAWTGDVWKTLLILLRHRPDLQIDVLDARPTGLVLLSGLDPENTTLAEAYDDLVAEYASIGLEKAGGLAGYYSEVRVAPAREILDRMTAH